MRGISDDAKRGREIRRRIRGFAEWLGRLVEAAGRLSRHWPWLLAGAAAIAGYLMARRWMGPLVLLQLAGSEQRASDAVSQLGGVDNARTALLLNLALLTPWIGALAGLTHLVRDHYYSRPLHRAGGPVIWGLLLALLTAGFRTAVLWVIAPDPGQAAVTVSSALGWATWVLILVALAYVVPIFFARLQVSRRRLDPVKASEVSEDFDDAMTAAPGMEKAWAPPRRGRRIGICVSGGGMRSAAFNLGALQALDEHGILGRAEYLVAVSGGAYIAGGFALAGLGAPTTPPTPFGRGSPEEVHLRRNSTYLVPNLAGAIRLLGRLLIGILINVVLVGLTVFVVGRAVGYVLSSDLLYPALRSGQAFEIFPSTWWATAGLAGGSILAAVLGAYRRRRSAANLDVWFSVAGLLMVMALVVVLLHVAIPWAVFELPGLIAGLIGGSGGDRDQTPELFIWFQVTGIGAILAGAIRSVLARKRSWLAKAVGAVVVPLMVAVGFLLAVNSTATRGIPHGLLLTVAAAAALALMVAVSDLTTWSMHPIYKRRLMSAFALRRRRFGDTGRQVAEPIPYGELEPISALGANRPELVVCAAANITDPEITAPGRYALTFTFSPTVVGGPSVGWLSTADYEAVLGEGRDEDITVPAAVAVSGAAISPAMGRMSRGRRSIGSAMALANVRLGVWLPNPRWVIAELRKRRRSGEADPLPSEWQAPPRATYLLKELAGRYAVDDKFVYVTDGGHWENLGLVEALRRGCTEVYCFDAAGDPPGAFSTLGRAIALARAELGVEVDIDPTVMRPEEGERWSVQGHAAGTLRFGGSGGRRRDGRIFFVKAVVTDSAPWDVKAFAERTPEFPNETTFDQLYEDDQFEAYRSLGHHLTEEALRG